MGCSSSTSLVPRRDGIPAISTLPDPSRDAGQHRTIGSSTANSHNHSRGSVAMSVMLDPTLQNSVRDATSSPAPLSLSARPPAARRSFNTPASSRTTRGGDMLCNGIVGSGHSRRSASVRNANSNANAKINQLLSDALGQSQNGASNTSMPLVTDAFLAERGITYKEFSLPRTAQLELPYIKMDATSAVVGSQLRTAARIERVVAYLDRALATNSPEVALNSAASTDDYYDDPEFFYTVS